MALLTIMDAGDIAHRRRPWSFRLENKMGTVTFLLPDVLLMNPLKLERETFETLLK